MSQPSLSTTEPVVLYQSIAVLVAIALGAFGIVIDPGVLVTAVLAVAAAAAPIIAAFKARKKVTPI